MKRKSRFITFIACLAIFCSGCGLLASSDAKAKFQSNKETLNEIVRLFEKEDRKLTYLNMEIEEFDHRRAGTGELSKIPKARLNEYRRLFNKLGFPTALRKDQRTGNISVVYSTEGFIGTDRETGFCYIYSMEKSRRTDFTNMKIEEIEGPWFIYHFELN